MEAFTEGFIADNVNEIFDHPPPPTVLIDKQGVHFVHKSHHLQRLFEVVFTSPLPLYIVPIQADCFI